MKVRIYYIEEGIHRTLLEADKKVLSDSAKVFLGFIEDYMKPKIRDPKFKQFTIEVEMYG